MIYLIEPLLEFISKESRLITELVGEKRKLHDAALSAVLEVAFETKVYLEKFEQSGTRNRTEEINLAKLWTKAAVPIARVNPQLANLCLSNVDPWISAGDWTAEEVERIRIGMCDVWEGVRKLLGR